MTGGIDQLRRTAERLARDYGHLLRGPDQAAVRRRDVQDRVRDRLDEARRPHGRDQLTLDDATNPKEPE